LMKSRRRIAYPRLGTTPYLNGQLRPSNQESATGEMGRTILLRCENLEPPRLSCVNGTHYRAAALLSALPHRLVPEPASQGMNTENTTRDRSAAVIAVPQITAPFILRPHSRPSN
jgi:uncharacterized caspase-like protein